MTPSPRSQPQSGTRLVAGRELDARIAEIEGWTDFVPADCSPEFDVTATPPNWNAIRYQRVPDYSTDISAAWPVLEKLTTAVDGDPGVEVMVKWSAYSRRWCAQIHDLSGKMRFANEKADSASHAICLAALAALANADPLSRPDDGGARP